MARTQANDYEERRAEIVEHAARLFAERGFLGASIADLAEACGTSKSLLYHYYPSKEDILFDAMHGHVRALLDVSETVKTEDGDAAAKLSSLTQRFMSLYLDAAARQRVLVNELRHLSDAQHKTIVGMQRRLVDFVESLLAQIRPELGRDAALRRPAAMLYFGMINWMHIWLDPRGAASPERIAALAVSTFIDGIRKGDIPRV